MQRYWESPETTGLHRLNLQPPAGDQRQLLQGPWRFQLRDEPLAAELEAWYSIDVPSLWTMGDFGDPPQYTNVQMPFDELPPFVPSMNPTGVYQCHFEVPAEWADQRVVLRVGGFEGVLRVELNGAVVGMAKDGRIAADFEVGPALREGDNALELYISKWSDASFIEDQDQWWHGGISREVELIVTPHTHVERLHVTPDLQDDHGLLRVRTSMCFAQGVPDQPYRLRVAIPELDFTRDLQLADGVAADAVTADEQALARAWFTSEFAVTGTPDDARQLLRRLEPPAAGNGDFTLRLPAVEPWSAERPRLYTVAMTLLGASDDPLQHFDYQLGFRSVEVVEGELLVNGQPVVLYGMNRHDFHPRTGRVQTPAEIREDLLELKRWNVNAIRTAHYPNDPALLHAADELGFYVVAEANIESHAHMHTIAGNPRYLAAFVDRVSRLVQRDMHHASVLMWSLGNESGYGANHDAAAAWVRRFDPTRVLHYEGAIRGDWTAGHAASDIVCPMYPSIDAIVAYAESGKVDRPLIMCEYSHAMGNSNGSLADYWHAIEHHRGLQGGFVWEMWDHGLWQHLPDGTERIAYGGDFGEPRHDGNFCCDGLFFPDRTAKPAMYEFKQLAAPLVIEAIEPADGRFQLRNRQFFTDIAGLELRWELTEDGMRVDAGTVGDIAALPRETQEFVIPAAALSPAGTGERFVTITALQREQTAWAAAGHEVSWAQFALPFRPTPAFGTRKRAEMRVGDDGSIRLGQLALSPEVSLWRAPTDNDRIGGVAQHWESIGIHRLERRIEEVVPLAADGTSITSRWTTRGGTSLAHHQFVTACEGGMRVREIVLVPDQWTDLARVGTCLELPLADTVDWFGLGPQETYPDRMLARVGRWSTAARDMQVPYIRPQHSGARVGVRWAELTWGGERWRITNDVPRQMTISPYTEQELAAATHREELLSPRRTVLQIDAAHRGIGTASCGPDILDAYRVQPGTYSWTWSLQRVQ